MNLDIHTDLLNELLDRTINALYPSFEEWCKKRGYKAVDGIYQIKLWYEFLGIINTEDSKKR